MLLLYYVDQQPAYSQTCVCWHGQSEEMVLLQKCEWIKSVEDSFDLVFVCDYYTFLWQRSSLPTAFQGSYYLIKQPVEELDSVCFCVQDIVISLYCVKVWRNSKGLLETTGNHHKGAGYNNTRLRFVSEVHNNPKTRGQALLCKGV